MLAFALLVCGIGAAMSDCSDCVGNREVCYFSYPDDLLITKECCPGTKCTPKGAGVGLCTPEDYCLVAGEACNDQNYMELFTIYTRSDCCEGMSCDPDFDDPSVHYCTPYAAGK